MRKQKVGDVRTHSVCEENWTRAQLFQLPCTLQERFRHSSKVLRIRNQFWVQNTERTSLYSFLNCVSISDLSFSWKPLDIDAALSLRPPTCVFFYLVWILLTYVLSVILSLDGDSTLPHLIWAFSPGLLGLAWLDTAYEPVLAQPSVDDLLFPTPLAFYSVIRSGGWNCRAVTLNC